MKRIPRTCVLLTVLVVLRVSPAVASDSPNVLLICVDDLRPELACFGKDYIRSPNIDKLATQGLAFHRHYVQAPTCGASRYALLTGTYGPSSNAALFQRAGRIGSKPNTVSPSFPAWFRQHGYTTVSVGKVSHHPGGRGGSDWDTDSNPEMPLSWDRHLLPAGDWKHPRGVMHGLANGEIRVKAGEMDVFQAVDGPDSIYPDGLIAAESLKQLDQLTADPNKPFFLAVGIIRPHLPFGAPAKYLKLYEGAKLPPIPHPTKPNEKTTWHGSGEFMKYNRWKRNPNTDAEFATEVRRHYAACVSYADAQVGKILERLKASGKADNTIVVLWGDHGWHLGEHAIWGKHALFEESLRSPLIISHPGLRTKGKSTTSTVESIDIFPTVCELAGLPRPDFVDGVSLTTILKEPTATGHAAISYSRARTIRSDTHRLITHADGHHELYDHRTEAAETKNIASEQPEVVEELLSQLKHRLDSAAKFRPVQNELPVAPPKDAIVLFDGDKTNRFLSKTGEPAGWPIENGELISSRGKSRTNHLVSQVHFRDADIHVEFQLPKKGSGNSGLYIHGNYELQIFNSHGKKKVNQGDQGALYGFAAPIVNASRPPGEWQVFDIRYIAPRRNAAGEIETEGSISAWLNGQRVQHNTRFGEPRSKYHPFRHGTTPYLDVIAKQQLKTSIGPLFLQDHDNPVKFRNIWIRPLDKRSLSYEPKVKR
jgi:iduronate 2-sulfatase